MVVKDIENPFSQGHIQLLLILVPHLTVNENKIILLRLVRPEICVYVTFIERFVHFLAYVSRTHVLVFSGMPD